MRYFDMGEEFIKWIKVLLQDRISCVRNAGYITPFFEMSRGVRQGCPISPLLFILAVELLAISIRNDENIKGIHIPGSPRTLKIMQYADDTTLFLRDMIDFREVLSKIKLFATFSGLYLNSSKSIAMMISDKSQKNTISHGIRFVNNLKILGIFFSNELKVSQISENIDPKIEKLKRICTLWSRRNLSIMGKITILKAFGISLFIYILQSIGISDKKLQEINTICFRFIWKKNYDGKRANERVKRKIVCASREYGGLKMLDIRDLQTSFLLEWAEKIISTENNSWKAIPTILFKRIGGISCFKSNVSPKEFKGAYLMKNDFWVRVLNNWLEMKEKLNNTTNRLEMNSPLFNNTLIVYKNKTIFNAQCCKKSIHMVSDVTANGDIIDLNNFKVKFGSRADTIFVYNVIWNALRDHISEIKNSANKNYAENDHILFNGKQVGEIGRKGFMSLIKNNNEIVPNIESVWNRKYNTIFQRQHWLIPYLSTSEVRLLVLQWKILHDIYS